MLRIMGLITTPDWEAHIGEQVRRARLHEDLTQKELARQANVGVVTLQNLESGKGSSLVTLIRVVRVLGHEEWLESLAPKPQISPIALARAQRGLKERQRATRRATPQKPSPGSTVENPA